MKKLVLPALAVCLLFVTAPAMLADVLDKETVTLSGTIYQPAPGSGKPLTTTSLTKKSLLVLFGYPNVNPANAKFYFDESTSSDVLGSADGNTIYGTLFTYTNSSHLDLLGASGKGADDGSASMINGGLTGWYFRSYHDTKSDYMGTVNFSGHGSLSATSSIIKGSFTYTQPVK